MPDELLTFAWEVPQGGFKWKGKSLTCDNGPLDHKRYFPPKDEPALFRIFADTPLTPEGIAAFAAKYGFFGLRRQDPAIADGFPCEDGDVWREEIGAMRDSVALWDAVRSGDTATLRARVVLDSDGRKVAFQRGDGASTTVENADWRPVNWGGAVPANLSEAALFLIQDETNRRLDGRTCARLLYRLLWTQLSLHIVPAHLAGALWLQFAEAVAGNKDYRRCDQCGRWFEVSPDKNRTDKKYCRDSCKSQRWRDNHPEWKRKRKAQATEGGSYRQETE